MSWTIHSSSQYSISLNFVGSMWMPPWPIQFPKNDILVYQKTHLDFFQNSCLCHSTSNTYADFFFCSSIIESYITMSTNTPHWTCQKMVTTCHSSMWKRLYRCCTIEKASLGTHSFHALSPWFSSPHLQPQSTLDNTHVARQYLKILWPWPNYGMNQKIRAMGISSSHFVCLILNNLKKSLALKCPSSS